MGFDSDETLETDKPIYYITKYFPFFLGGMSIYWSLEGFIFPKEFVAKDGEVLDFFWEKILVGLVGLLFIFLGILIYQKLVTVEMDNQTITIKKGDKDIVVKWLDVESVGMIRIASPPLYKLRIKNHEDYFLFNTSNTGFGIFIAFWDWSDMGKLIRDKKERFGL